MAIISGTPGADQILLAVLSAGVTTDSAAPGTQTGEPNVIDAGAGDDVVEAGDVGDDVHGGTGNDRITGNIGSDWLRGDAGSDFLIGGAGSFDVLDGGGGADRMFGGDGLDFYAVDSYADVVFDDGTTPDDAYDVIVTNLNYTLSERAGVEGLQLGDEIFGVGAKPWTIYGGGNSHDNAIIGNGNANILDGKGGTDIVQGLEGNDLVLGGAGDDDVSGWEGRDVVRGQDGDDYSVWGGADQDRLVGGRGNDTFFFNYVSESVPGAADVIACGDGAVAFENPGAAAGDLIWLPNALSPQTASEPIGPFTFGGTGLNQVSCVDAVRDTLVRANVDDDPAFEFVIRIADGAVRASAYTADDFFLG